MASTIENADNCITTKIDCIFKLIDVLEEIGKIDKTDITRIKNDYEMNTITIMAKYYELNSSIDCIEDEAIKHELLKSRDIFYKDYQLLIKQHNYIGQIDRQYNIVYNFIENNKNSISKPNVVKNLITQYENNSVQRSVSQVSCNVCSNCGNQMKLCSTSEIICFNCGAAEYLYGTIFEDDQYYTQDNQRTKHGTYDPSKHCRFWLERIQARESKEIPLKVIEKIKKLIKENKIRNIKELKCSDIRKFLSQTKSSSYNEHVPLILKMITGKSPPQLTDNEYQLITIYFDKVIRIYEEIKPPGKINVPYHPYLIYKIIEHTIKEQKKREELLNCIHLQSRETLIENDKMWKKICHHLQTIKYVPTDRR